VKDHIWKRVLDIGDYILASRQTVREAARRFGVSKSTVHKDLTERLPRVNPKLAQDVKHVLDTNKAERHLRGGEATRRKFMEREYPQHTHP
jgi:putative DeoR family transcriptional regulator (stage III sporulation protein D)